MATTEEKTETTENNVLEENFRMFGIFRMTWKDVKELNDEERVFLLDKADEIEAQAKKQAELQRQMQMQQQQQQQQMQQMQNPQHSAPPAGSPIVTPAEAVQQTSRLPDL